MNTGAFGEGFPYSNFHDLNMDWIIKIAKDFLDQYTHIQEIIENGEASLQNLTEDGIAQLQDKADALEALLQQWYNTHSEDIAGQLADALADILSSKNSAISAIDGELATVLASFNSQADQKAQQTIASIPGDYTELSNKVAIVNKGIQLNYTEQETGLNKALNAVRLFMPFQYGRYTAVGGFNDNVHDYIRSSYPYPAGTFRIRGYLFNNLAVQYFTDSAGTSIEDSYSQGMRIISPTAPWYITFSGSSDFTDNDIKNIENLFIVEQLNTYNERIITDYQTGRYISGGYNDSVSNYARNSIPFPAGTYKINQYSITSRPYQYSTDSSGISLTNGWSAGAYIITATTIWYLNFNKDGTFSQSDLEDIKENLVIERIPDITIEKQVSDTDTELNLQKFPSIYTSYNSTLSSTQKMVVESNSIMKNQRIEFSAKIYEMGTIAVGHGETRDGIYLVVDDTNIQFANNGTGFRTIAHGLSIADYITVIMEADKALNIKATIITRSGIFTTSVQVQTAWANNIFAQCVSGTFNNCRLTWECDDYNKPLWMFGDSYFSLYNDSRWTNIVVNNLGYDNILMNAHPGENSEVAYAELQTALTHSTPRYLFWCIGMNDPDTDSAPNASWLSTIQNIMNICTEKGITLYLATIPIVEDTTYNNEHKNAYIQNSGYPYVDFANAVYGISNWSSDGIHPNADGAKILAMKALAELPIIMMK